MVCFLVNIYLFLNTIKFTKNFVVGEKYTILINEKNPKKFIINKKVKIDEMLILLIGLFLLLSGILYALIS